MGELRVNGKDVKIASKEARAKIEKREKREKAEAIKDEDLAE
jgi:hypothetical protein